MKKLFCKYNMLKILSSGGGDCPMAGRKRGDSLWRAPGNEKSWQTKKAHCFHSALYFLAERKGLEPSASGVTGRRYNRLNYRSGYGGQYRT